LVLSLIEIERAKDVTTNIKHELAGRQQVAGGRWSIEQVAGWFMFMFMVFMALNIDHPGFVRELKVDPRRGAWAWAEKSKFSPQKKKEEEEEERTKLGRGDCKPDCNPGGILLEW
jgi:hypothetical protein